MHVFHCSYHKCLTVYYGRVVGPLYNRTMPWTKGYRHFNSDLLSFYDSLDELTAASVNNHFVDLARLESVVGDFRLSRLVRDPRDLVVSGYFYHLRGAEVWCRTPDPTEHDWMVVNGVVPDGMNRGESFETHLQSLSKEDGLLAELEFRCRHFDGMEAWAQVDDPRVRVWRYEEILGNEPRVFSEILKFYGLPAPMRLLGSHLASRFSASRWNGKTKHIRNPRPSQWREHFTPAVARAFNDRYAALVERLGYPVD